MSQFTQHKVTVTVDGVKRQIGPGNTSFKELIAELGLNAKTTSFAVTAAPAQPSSIAGNFSYNFQGGEVLVSTIGA